MKTTKVLLVATITVASFLSCQNNTDELREKENEVSITRPSTALNYKELVVELNHYDETRKKVLESSLGFEDTRVNYYSIEQLESYLSYVKNLSQEKGIDITGINFISAAYPKNYKNSKQANYQTLVLVPTTIVNGENIAFDAVQSSSEKTVTFKEMLAKYGYNWKYDTSKDYNDAEKNKVVFNRELFNKSEDSESSSSNRMRPVPPY